MLLVTLPPLLWSWGPGVPTEPWANNANSLPLFSQLHNRVNNAVHTSQRFHEHWRPDADTLTQRPPQSRSSHHKWLHASFLFPSWKVYYQNWRALVCKQGFLVLEKIYILLRTKDRGWQLQNDIKSWVRELTDEKQDFKQQDGRPKGEGDVIYIYI